MRFVCEFVDNTLFVRRRRTTSPRRRTDLVWLTSTTIPTSRTERTGTTMKSKVERTTMKTSRMRKKRTLPQVRRTCSLKRNLNFSVFKAAELDG